MLFETRVKKYGVLMAAVSFLFGGYALPVFAAQEMTIDDYLDDARPYLHHSCESAWYATDEDADEYVAIINRFVAVVFINHDFDVQRIEEAPAADQERLREIFYNEIGKRCKEKPQQLLAGIVERSLEFALNEMKQAGS